MTLEGRTRRVWRRPIQLAALTTIGLISALLGTGVWRWLAWLCLGIPIAAAFRALLFRTR
jgi:hypothetical protein